MCNRGPAAADSLQYFAAADNKLIKWPNTHIISYQGPFFIKTDYRQKLGTLG